MTIERVSAWIDERRQALAAADNLQEAERERDELDQRTGAVAARLRQELAAVEALTDPVGDLPGLVAQAMAYSAQQAAASALAATRRIEREKAQLLLPSLKAAVDTASNKWREWQEASASRLGTS